MKKCAMCSANAEVTVSWPATVRQQRHDVCDSCGHLIWDKISRDFSGTEACMGFTIEPLDFVTSDVLANG